MSLEYSLIFGVHSETRNWVLAFRSSSEQPEPLQVNYIIAFVSEVRRKKIAQKKKKNEAIRLQYKIFFLICQLSSETLNPHKKDSRSY